MKYREINDLWNFALSVPRGRLQNLGYCSKIEVVTVACNYKRNRLVDCAYLAANFDLEDLWSSVPRYNIPKFLDQRLLPCRALIVARVSFNCAAV